MLSTGLLLTNRTCTKALQSSKICDALRDLVSSGQFKKRKKTHGGGLLLVTLACNFTKSNTPLWVFFTF